MTKKQNIVWGQILLIIFVFLIGLFVGVTYTANDMKKIYKDYDVKVEHHNMSADYNYCPVCGTKLKETMDD